MRPALAEGRKQTEALQVVSRQNLVTIDIVDFLQPSATLYSHEGITIFAVLLFQSNTNAIRLLRTLPYGNNLPS